MALAHGLAFLLLLDYSGSMEQKVENRPKIQILKSEIDSLLSTADGNRQSTALIFGSRPEKKCNDLIEAEKKTAELRGLVHRLQPGAYGQTPLAKGLRLVVRKAFLEKARHTLVLTDGADSCGEDPCEALKQEDKKIKSLRRKIQIHIIGFDLKNEKNRLQCLADLHLKNISVSLTEAGNGEQLQKKLKEFQEDDMDLPFDAKNAVALDGHPHIKQSRSKASSQPGKKDPAAMAALRKKNQLASLEISGAPAEASFQIKGRQESKQWLGPYVVQLKAGDYLISYLSPNGKELHLNLPGGSSTKIPWAELMKSASSNLSILSPQLNITIHPAERTKLIHGDLKDIEIPAHLDGSRENQGSVPAGDWEIEVTSPPWLSKGVPPRKLFIPFQGEKKIDLESEFQELLHWIENPHPESTSVLGIKRGDGNEERFLVPPGTRRIPLLKGQTAFWYRSNGN